MSSVNVITFLCKRSLKESICTAVAYTSTFVYLLVSGCEIAGVERPLADVVDQAGIVGQRFSLLRVALSEQAFAHAGDVLDKDRATLEGVHQSWLAAGDVQL